MKRTDVILRQRRILLRRRDALQRRLYGQLSRLNNGEPTVGDDADAAVFTEHGEIDSQLAEAESHELAHIEAALERMEEGVYGICEQCERPIPQARLTALPYTTLCIECQRSHEEGPSRRFHPGLGHALVESESTYEDVLAFRSLEVTM